MSETTPANFVLTPLGHRLRKDAPDSEWASVVFWGDLLADNWSYLTECVRTGDSAFRLAERDGAALRWSKVPDANAIFRAVMGTAPAQNYMPIARAWDFSKCRTVADLGGGGGALIAAILAAYPNVRGMLVDRPESIEAARPRFAREGLADRCRLIAADLKTEVPPGADVYTMQHVLHGYDDGTALEILRLCRGVVPPDGRLLVIEFVLPDVVDQPDPGLEHRLMSDLNMMAVTGGKERSALEWKDLLHRAGFEIQGIVPSHRGPVPSTAWGSASIVEAA